MSRNKRLSEDEFEKVEEEVFGKEEELVEEPLHPAPVKGVKGIPKFKTWAEREKFYMKQK